MIVLTVWIHAKASTWQTLEPIGASVSSESFNFETDVKVMKITWQEKGYREQMDIATVSLGTFDESIIKQFNHIKSKYSPKANMKYMGNAFLIDNKGKIWQMDMVEDVISLMGNIDTPFEAQLLLWLHQGKNAKDYKKTSEGYILRVESYKNKKCYLAKVLISKKAILTTVSLKQDCQKIAQKKHITHNIIKYQRFDDIVMDAKENIYLLGSAIDTKSNNSEVFTIDKYDKHGKKIWQKIIRNAYMASAKMLAFDSKYLYLIDTSNRYEFILQYSLEGTLISNKAFDAEDKKQFEAIYKKSSLNKIKKAPYYRDTSGHEIYFVVQVGSKDGNIYAVGSEIENIIKEDVIQEECGNTDRYMGALLVKFDKSGNQVWSKVIDLK